MNKLIINAGRQIKVIVVIFALSNLFLNSDVEGLPKAHIYLIRDIYPGFDNCSGPLYLTECNNMLYFTAYEPLDGRELWASDGTEAGTVLVKDIYPGHEGSRLYRLTNYNNKLYFRATDSVNGIELWVSDGTKAGTLMVKDIYPGNGHSNPGSFTEYEGRLYFHATDGSHGCELWVSDGTEAGTLMVKDICPGSGHSDPINLVEFTNKLYFSATDGSHGCELWISDGTEAGTLMVKDICPGSGHSNPGSFTEYEGRLYFRATDGSHGCELWTSDGTEAGTLMVKDICPGSGHSDPINLVEFNNKLYFSACEPLNGRELWVSDGTEAGTVMLKDICTGVCSSEPAWLTNYNYRLYFRAEDSVNGAELWASDGTEAGTVMVKDIYPGNGSSRPLYLMEYNNNIYFSAFESLNGRELWVSDGTEAGTVMVQDINPGGVSSGPEYLIEYNFILYFGAYDYEHGKELRAMALCGDGTIDPGEECEEDSDCSSNHFCDECICYDMSDADSDGIFDYADNCPHIPNGPDGGTCTEGSIGTPCMAHEECGSSGFCSTQQEDSNSNGLGDVCECEIDEDCNDGVDCTDDTCISNICQNTLNDDSCDDEVFCNGAEYCDPIEDCQSGTPPCTLPFLCDEELDECVMAEVVLTPEDAWYNPNEAQEVTVKKPVCLSNPDDLVGGIQFDLCEYNLSGERIDCMECIDCELTERTTMFDCVVLELPEDNSLTEDVDEAGCCRVIVFCKNPGCAINPGLCDIVTVVYKALPISEECPGDECITQIPENIVASDYDGYPLTAAGMSGTVCPFICGDMCPADDPLSPGWDCGDGVVDIYDIMCEVDFALTVATPDECQAMRANVPTGTPPHCTAPDFKCSDTGEACTSDDDCPAGTCDAVINILDVMVIIDMALDRQDCCTFYYTGVM